MSSATWSVRFRCAVGSGPAAAAAPVTAAVGTATSVTFPTCSEGSRNGEVRHEHLRDRHRIARSRTMGCPSAPRQRRRPRGFIDAARPGGGAGRRAAVMTA